MRVLAVAQAFKETLSAREVAGAMETGIRAAGAEPTVLIGSDGGDGLAEALAAGFKRRSRHSVSGPLADDVVLEVGWLDPKTAVIESRLVCGLSLVPPNRRNPLLTTTRGVGELVNQLVEAGAAAILVGLGGSATMDGGVGMARAWGWEPRDSDGHRLPEGGGALALVATLGNGRSPGVRLTGLIDVFNPLTGPTGAREYAAQKGASPEQGERLDRGLQRLAALATAAGKGDLAYQPGAGAAGGLGFGLAFFGGGSLVSGASWVLQQIGFPAALKTSDLVICGEGAFDTTSLNGKLTGSILAAVREQGIPAGLLAPTAHHVPEGVLLQTGGERWTEKDLARHTTLLVERALRT